MTNLWLTLLIKSTIILAAGALTAQLLRTCAAAIRHLVWLCTFAALLTLPAGLLLPRRVLPRTWVVRSSVAGSGATAAQSRSTRNVPLAIWAAGTGLLLLRLAVAGIRAARLVQQSRPVGNISEHPIRISRGIDGPLAWSFGKGTVMLPDEAERWQGNQLTAAVKHEAAHLARLDSQALLAGELACALYWFHPLVWYAAHRMRVEQEHAADDCVLQDGLAPVEYASQLLNLARSGRREQLLAGAGTKSMLTARVEAILDAKRRRTMLNRRAVFGIIAAVLAIVLPLAAMQTDRKVYKIGEDGVTAPSVVYKEEPNYTEEARDAKIQGTVLLSGIIGADGRASDVRVERGLDPGLDANAIEAVNRWMFKPAQKNGEAVAVSVRIEVNFRLK